MTPIQQTIQILRQAEDTIIQLHINLPEPTYSNTIGHNIDYTIGRLQSIITELSPPEGE